MQNYIEQRAVDLQSAVVVDETQFSEPVHEIADSRTSGADHLCQRFLANPGNHRLRNAFLAETRQQ